MTGLNDKKIISSPKTLKIPVYLNENINIISGNNTTFLLSSQRLDTNYSIEKDKVEVDSFNENEHITPITDKQKTKNSLQKYNLSNICGT